jgi:hypothetical protein
MRIEPLPELIDERARLLAEGEDLPRSLCSVLARDALALGARRVRVIADHKPWAAVAADRDWITSDDLTLEQAFGDMLLWPGTSKYFRAESRVLAIASSVFVWRSGGVRVLSGQAPPDAVRDALGGYAFAVGFNCE